MFHYVRMRYTEGQIMRTGKLLCKLKSEGITLLWTCGRSAWISTELRIMKINLEIFQKVGTEMLLHLSRLPHKGNA